MDRKLNVLIACEESQRVCSSFRELGHNAYSCDIQPCSGGHNEWHIMGDCLPLLNGDCDFTTQDGKHYRIDGKWDLIVAHPPCTYLANCQANLYNRDRLGDAYVDNRLRLQRDGIEFFLKFTNLECAHIAIENPVGKMSTIYRKADQIIQPYQFGDGFRKATCLWLKNLPKLIPTNIVQYEFYEYKSKSGKIKTDVKWRVQGKQKDWAKNRSKTFWGIAHAIASQWSKYLLSEDLPQSEIKEINK